MSLNATKMTSIGKRRISTEKLNTLHVHAPVKCETLLYNGDWRRNDNSRLCIVTEFWRHFVCRWIPDVNCCVVQDILAFVDRFSKYSVLWNQQRDIELQTFLGADPHLSDFEEKFRFYEELEEQILSEPDSAVVGPIAVHTGNVHCRRDPCSLFLSVFVFLSSHACP